jgi:hypothetical protein
LELSGKAGTNPRGDDSQAITVWEKSCVCVRGKEPDDESLHDAHVIIIILTGAAAGRHSIGVNGKEGCLLSHGEKGGTSE